MKLSSLETESLAPISTSLDFEDSCYRLYAAGIGPNEEVGIMDISELWLEDLFKIYVGANLADRLGQVGENRVITLDRGPFQGRPRAYRSTDFGTPTAQQLLEVVRQKLQLKRQQEDVAVMGYYIRFVNDIRVVRDESRRNGLRNEIRYSRRIQITNNGVYEAAKRALLTAFSQYEERVWAARSSQISEARMLRDRLGMYDSYSAGLAHFYGRIKHIVTALPGPSILNVGPRAIMEADFEVSQLPLSPHPIPREGQQAGLRAWNALLPGQRSAAVYHFSGLGDTLHREYLDLHTRRSMPHPDPVPDPTATVAPWNPLAH